MAIEMLLFPRSQQVLYIPFTVINDNVAEFQERFDLLVSVPKNGGYRIGENLFADVFIRDDDSEGVK